MDRPDLAQLCARQRHARLDPGSQAGGLPDQLWGTVQRFKSVLEAMLAGGKKLQLETAVEELGIAPFVT